MDSKDPCPGNPKTIECHHFTMIGTEVHYEENAWVH